MANNDSTAFTRVAADLRSRISGRVFGPGDDGYETARKVWNGMIDRRPAMVARPVSADEVRTTLLFGLERELTIAVRGGGHNVAGNGTVDGGLVIDLGAMRDVHVRPDGQRVRVGAGATLGDVDRGTQAFGLAVPLGVISRTGVAGLTLGGGIGWLTRRHGLTIDNLESVEIVTAGLSLVRVDQRSEPDLFWAIRGGGGNFGIVTAFEFHAHPLGPNVFCGAVFHRRPRWAEALRFYADWSATLPDDLATIVSFITPPPGWVPENMEGEPLLVVAFVWTGARRSDAERLIAPLRAFGPPDCEVIDESPWVDWQSSLDSMLPQGTRAYWKNVAVDELDETTISTLVEHASSIPTNRTGVDIHHLGGAFEAVPDSATAFPNRRPRYWLNINGGWDEPADDEKVKSWVRGLHGDLSGRAAAGVYVNFVGLEEARLDARAQALAAYGSDKFARLVAVKDRFDPDNVFHLNHNIPPSASRRS